MSISEEISYIYNYALASYDYFINKLTSENETPLFSPALDGLISGIILGIKSCLMIFVFIWVRASFPRIRFDQLMLFCWIHLLPLVIAFIVLIPCVLYSFEIIPSNILII